MNFREKIALVFILVVVSLNYSFAQKWQEIETVDDVCKAYPDQMKTMLNQFDLNYPGLEKVKAAYNSGDLVAACTQLLDYYKNEETIQYLRREQPEISRRTDNLADTILTDVFVVQNVRGKVPWGDDGHRDWYYKGPNNDEEWAWLSNRHGQISHVFNVFFETGNPKYLEYIDLFLRDFIIKSMPYPQKKSGTSVWRGLEVAARVKVWSRIFYGTLNNKDFSDATRLLMLSSLADHAHYNRNFHAQNNWLTMEISALATAATNFPEYKKSSEYLEYAANTISESMKGQVYPDGVQTELTSHYHNVALQNFDLFKEICDRANYQLPVFFNKTIENMYRYAALIIRPDGNRILNNDGDLGSNVPLILTGAEKYNKPEWEYIATNGSSGSKPVDGPSYFFPWAGQLISRSGFDKDAHWSFFDVGPWGSGHQHNDMLHISVSAYGRDLLVDAGRFAYRGEVADKFRGYARGTQGHNSVLVDGKGQLPGVSVAEKAVSDDLWAITPDYDCACGSFDKYEGLKEVKHNRAIMYVRNEFWVVVDRIETDKPREIETLWHWHPDCEVEADKNGVLTTKNEKGNLQLIPVDKNDWKVEEIEGQEKPEIQGWYSEEYNKFCPNKAFVYSTDSGNDECFVWLLLPSEKEAPKVAATIISRDSTKVKLEVTKENKKWELDIPFSNSRNVNFELTKY
ncbi:alginate lyase family protein [Draconibacterium sediminis]|uniref:Heparinase n=1 Tax=Draconibacterium sediminis TaxID=1544798 RepID=A0A0D8J5X3_9BACT|nr:alginate lyase family protein [Draconibacterium sediminis]KJF42355.1 heparinase [Draconibacterium sediminis]